MDNTTIAIESLRTFALSENEISFAHLCTAALAGEEWAMERIVQARARLSQFNGGRNNEVSRIYVLRSTNTTRPNGTVARSFEV